MPHRNFSARQRGHARELRTNMTDAEKKLWYRLRAHRFQGAGFRRQVPLGPYIADFVCHDAGLIIELDGGQHGMAGGMERDRQRTDWMEGKGYRVLRFWNNDCAILTAYWILTALKATPPSRTAAQRRPDLPLKGGGVRQEQP